jgi:epoxyqueuosine reductase
LSLKRTQPYTLRVDGPERTRWIVEQARTLGFDLCGVTPADALEGLDHLPEWLDRGYAGEMEYLHDPRRRDPVRALAGARSIIVCALNYNTPLRYSTEAAAEPRFVNPESDAPRGWISRYAWGDDYHEVLELKLDALAAAMRKEFQESFVARVYVDTGPVVERVAANHAGLGWLAKNTCLIHERLGSWLFLGVILTTLELTPTAAPGDPPPPDLCGNCRLCIDACPTGAIVEPYVLDARRCISYLTIEMRGTIPEELRPGMGRMVFGCDICQDVCPWNRKAPVTNLAQFLPRGAESTGKDANGQRKNMRNQSGVEGGSLFAPSIEWLASFTEDEFRQVFRGSPVKRTKWRGLIRNACVALGNSSIDPGSPSYPRIIRLLDRLAASEDALIVEHARWAAARLRDRHGSQPADNIRE